MSLSLVVKDGARVDITEAFRQYSLVSSQLGEAFLDRVDEAFERICSGPEAYGRVLGEIRQMRLRRFPYVVSYLVEDEQISILAVLHGPELSHDNPNLDRAGLLEGQGQGKGIALLERCLEAH